MCDSTQAGSYTCTAYNDLGNLKSSVRLAVFYAPSCRLRKVLIRRDHV